ncbi:metacaspase-8-like [Brassica napus]|uniref:metacaspase-8-like n=1 Tax=Brassica napus TaxID=3708 RepID=UPI002078DBB4|nr:metacaspase-8-like [Brassica napus]
MAKKALLIGINYPGTAVELRGCVNDVRRMQKCLIDRYGFSNKDITVLIDTDKTSIQPTGKNIREALKKLIAEGEPGDVLVFHYSGHGTRLPTEEGLFDATDYDECITPCDMNLITDNEFRDMVAEVKKGCLLTIISDSCHSGGLIEEAKEQIGESYVNKPRSRIVTFLVSIVRSLLTTCGISSNDSQRGSGGGHDSFTRESELEDGETVDMKTRYLPLDSYITLLKEQTGQTDIKYGKIRQTLVKVFGQDSSPNVMLSNSVKRNAHRGLLSMFVGKREVNTDGAGSEVKSKHPNNGILLSGCQTDQRSEDVYVTRTGKSYGAFSDAIQTILSGTRKEITNKEMVLRAREILKKQKFGQRPGLYCHDRYVNIPFIC